MTWHLLRHWNATMMMEENVPIKVAQERLGHLRIETTMKYYVHATPDSHEQAAKIPSRCGCGDLLLYRRLFTPEA